MYNRFILAEFTLLSYTIFLTTFPFKVLPYKQFTSDSGTYCRWCTYISKACMGRTLLLSIRFEILLFNKHCDLTTPRHCNHSGADTPVYDTYDKAGSYNSLCSHSCQSSGKTAVKLPRHTSPYHILRSWPVNPLTICLSHILTGWGTTSQLLGWGKTHHKQHGHA